MGEEENENAWNGERKRLNGRGMEVKQGKRKKAELRGNKKRKEERG
jgi:hypothetical protein